MLLDVDEARTNVLRVITEHGLLPGVIAELRCFGYSIDTASPERLRRAGVIAVQDKRRFAHSSERNKFRDEDDGVIAELARAIGIKPTVETPYYHKTQNEYTRKYGKNRKS